MRRTRPRSGAPTGASALSRARCRCRGPARRLPAGAATPRPGPPSPKPPTSNRSNAPAIGPPIVSPSSNQSAANGPALSVIPTDDWTAKAPSRHQIETGLLASWRLGGSTSEVIAERSSRVGAQRAQRGFLRVGPVVVRGQAARLERGDLALFVVLGVHARRAHALERLGAGRRHAEERARRARRAVVGQQVFEPHAQVPP